MKKLIKIILSLALVFVFVKPVGALSDTVTISELGEFTRSDNFYLSYSSLSSSPVTAQFYWMKEGGSWATLGAPISGYNGQLQVTGSQLNEQVKYYFKVEINGGTASDQTSIFYDISGPSPVQNYWKERVVAETYRLHWKNPGDSDFSRVFVYRSENVDFDANNSTKIAEVGGAPDADVTYDVIGLDASKQYYFALRAVDTAGNPSSIVTDPEVGATIEQETIVGEAGENVSLGEGIITPSEGEEIEGSVLGEKEDGNEDDGLIEEIKKALGSEGEDGAVGSGFWSFITWARIRAFVATILVLLIIKKIFFRKKK